PRSDAMDPHRQLLVAFAGGSLATALITAFVTRCLVHPVISVRLDEKKGSYGQVPLVAPGNPSVTSQAKFFRLHVENTRYSSLKGCSGYITKMAKRVQGMGSAQAHLEIIDLGWAHRSTEPRDIPRGAFFHLDVATLHLQPGGNVLWISHYMPTNLVAFFAGKATYEVDILIAADNDRPRRIHVEFGIDPRTTTSPSSRSKGHATRSEHSGGSGGAARLLPVSKRAPRLRREAVVELGECPLLGRTGTEPALTGSCSRNLKRSPQQALPHLR